MHGGTLLRLGVMIRRPKDGWRQCPRCDAELPDSQRVAAECPHCAWHIGSCDALFRRTPRLFGWRPIVSVAIVAAVIGFVSPSINFEAVRAGENEATLFVVLIGAVVCFAIIRGLLAWSTGPRVLFNQDGVTFDGTGLPRDAIPWRDFETAEVVGKPPMLRLSASWDYVAAEIAPHDLGGMEAAREIAAAITAMRSTRASVA